MRTNRPIEVRPHWTNVVDPKNTAKGIDWTEISQYDDEDFHLEAYLNRLYAMCSSDKSIGSTTTLVNINNMLKMLTALVPCIHPEPVEIKELDEGPMTVEKMRETYGSQTKKKRKRNA